MGKFTQAIRSMLMMVLMLSAYIQTVSAWNGAGTEIDPYRLTSSTDIKQLSDNVNDGTDYSGIFFKLTSDIDLSGLCGKDIGNWTPIGNSPFRKFSGIIDGSGYTISNLYINSPSASAEIGLFGNIENSTIQNLNLRNPVLLGYEIVGGLAASATKSKITAVNIINGELSASKSSAKCGGIVGYNISSIIGCTISGTVINSTDSNSTVGGIAGFSNYSALITTCLSNITGSGGVRGSLAGRCFGTFTTGFYVPVNGIEGIGDPDHSTGSVYNIKAKTIAQMNDKPAITALNRALATSQTPFHFEPASDTNSDLPKIKPGHPSTFSISGLVTYNSNGSPVKDATIKIKIGTEEIALVQTSEDGLYSITALPPNSYSLEASCTGQSNHTETIDLYANITGKNISLHSQYEWYKNGTSPYTINSLQELTAVVNIVNGTNLPDEIITDSFFGKTIILGSDMDMSEVCGEKAGSWIPIGTSANPFEGTFDGAWHTLSNLYINSTAKNQALFGSINKATVKNLKMSIPNVTSIDYVGAVVAHTTSALSRIEGITVAGGTVTGTNSGAYCGAIAGCNSEAVIIGCVVNGTSVKTAEGGYAGAIVGFNYNDGILVGCVSTIPSLGETGYRGCVAGYNAGSISTSYYTAISDLKAIGSGPGVIFDTQAKTVTEMNNNVSLFNLNMALGKQNTPLHYVAAGRPESDLPVITTGALNLCAISGTVTDSNNNVGVEKVLVNVRIGNDIVTSATTGSDGKYSTTVVKGDAYNITTSCNRYNIYSETLDISSDITKDISVISSYNWYRNDADGYIIRTAEELKAFANIVNNTDLPVDIIQDMFSDKPVTIGNDIDLSTVCGPYTGNWTPIGIANETGKEFRGIFDGKGYTISNLYINAPDKYQQGLFRHGTTTIMNLTLKSPTVIGASYVGALAGDGYTGLFSGIAVVDGTIQSTTSEYCGGIDGFHFTVHPRTYIAGCTVSNTKFLKGKEGGSKTGGITGHNITTLIGCLTLVKEMDVNGEHGLIAGNNGKVITSCYYVPVGNIPPFINDEKFGSYSDVEAKTTAQMNESITIYNLNVLLSEQNIQSHYVANSNTDLLPKIKVGRLVNYQISGKIINAASKEPVSGLTVNLKIGDEVVKQALTDSNGTYHITALAHPGYSVEPIVENYVHQATTVDLMGDINNIDFTLQATSDTPYKWYIGHASPYEISSAEELKMFVNLVNGTSLPVDIMKDSFKNKTINLAGDIDLSSVCGPTLGNWTSAGLAFESAFEGTFDGKDHTISNIFVVCKDENTNKEGGLFRYTKNAVVKNFTLKDPEIVNFNNAGGVIVDAYYTILDRITVIGGSISSKTQAGGVASLAYESTVKCCRVSGTRISDISDELDAILGGVASVSSRSDIYGCISQATGFKISSSTGSKYQGILIGVCINNGTVYTCAYVPVAEIPGVYIDERYPDNKTDIKEIMQGTIADINKPVIINALNQRLEINKYEFRYLPNNDNTKLPELFDGIVIVGDVKWENQEKINKNIFITPEGKLTIVNGSGVTELGDITIGVTDNSSGELDASDLYDSITSVGKLTIIRYVHPSSDSKVIWNAVSLPTPPVKITNQNGKDMIAGSWTKETFNPLVLTESDFASVDYDGANRSLEGLKDSQGLNNWRFKANDGTGKLVAVGQGVTQLRFTIAPEDALKMVKVINKKIDLEFYPREAYPIGEYNQGWNFVGAVKLFAGSMDLSNGVSYSHEWVDDEWLSVRTNYLINPFTPVLVQASSSGQHVTRNVNKKTKSVVVPSRINLYMPSQLYYGPTTGVEGNEFGEFKVYGKTGEIVIEGITEESAYSVYNISGISILPETRSANSNVRIPVQAGIYMVKIDGNATVVMVK